MKPSIIVEGPDASGKSSLVTKLSKHYGIYPFIAGPKPVNMKHAEVCMIYQLHWLELQPCVWDRFTGISNVCNLPEIESDIDLAMHAGYVKAAMSRSSIIICTHQDLSKHKKTVVESDEDEKRMIRESRIVYKNYIEMSERLPNAIAYDYTKTSFTELVGLIDDDFSKRIQSAVH